MRVGLCFAVILLLSAPGASAARDYLAEFTFDGDPGKFADLSVRPYVLTRDGFVGSVGANYARSLASRGIKFRVLDEDTEGKYYWITETAEREGFSAAGVTSAGAKIYSTYDRYARPAPGARAIRPIDVDFRALARPRPRIKFEYSNEVAEIVASITEAELMEYDTDLVNFGTRYSYTEELKEAADYLEDKLESWGYTVGRDRYFGDNLSAVSAAGAGAVWAAGAAGAVFRSVDDGAFWAPVVFPSTSDLYSIIAVSPTVAICGGKKGTIYTTYDGGLTWSETEVGGYVRAVVRSPSDTYWAVNTEGRIYRSSDGLDWAEAAYVGDRWLNDIAFDAAGNGVVVGGDGYIAHSDDDGATWTAISSGTDLRISAVAFASAGTAVAVGEGGYVARSTDGGVTWTKLDLGTEKYLHAVAFPTWSDGYVAGDTGAFYVSHDGGFTWSRNENAPPVTLESISSAGPDDLWVAPLLGGALFYTDGADTWIDQAENADITSTSVWENLFAVLPGSGASDAVAVSAHYDSTSGDHELSLTWAPGANDNATGVSALLAAARIMAGYDFGSDVYYVFFSGEELGLLGSSHYAAEVGYAGLPLLGVINVDCIGWTDGAGPDLNILTNEQSLWLSAFYQLSGSTYVPSVDTIRERDDEFYLSDHAPFWRFGYPALLVIEHTISPYINTEYDTQEKLAPAYFTANAKTVAAAVASLAGPGAEGPAPDALADVRVYPNPYNPINRTGSGLVFEGLPDGSTVRLYNVAGEKVFEAGGPTAGVLVVYPVTTAGLNLASGVYIYRVSAPGGETAVGKLAVLK